MSRRGKRNIPRGSWAQKRAALYRARLRAAEEALDTAIKEGRPIAELTSRVLGLRAKFQRIKEVQDDR